MKRKNVIKSSLLPTRSPVGIAILFWMLLDRLAAPGWAFGELWTLAPTNEIKDLQRKLYR